MGKQPHFRAPRLSDAEIRKAADDFRDTYMLEGELPLDVLEIAEFDLDLTLQPVSGLKSAGDVEALLLSDFQTIILDKDDFMDPRFENRIRYSVAHELGHYVLHRDIIQGIRPTTPEKWIELIGSIDDYEYGRIEYQAYEFAGRLLVPVDILEQSIENLADEIEKAYVMSPDVADEMIIQYVAGRIGKRFGVSGAVIEKRIRNEQMWRFGSR